MRWHDRCQSQTPAQMKVDCYDDHSAPPLVYPPADRSVPRFAVPQLGSDGPWGCHFRLQPFPAAPPAGRSGAGQAGSPCRQGANGGLTRLRTDPSMTSAPSSRRGVGHYVGLWLFPAPGTEPIRNHSFRGTLARGPDVTSSGSRTNPGTPSACRSRRVCAGTASKAFAWGQASRYPCAADACATG
jgi:hypothetical protein